MIWRAGILATGLLLFLCPGGECDGDLHSLLAVHNPVFFGFPDNEAAAGAELEALDINPAAVALSPSGMLLVSYTAASGGGEHRRLVVPVKAGAGFVIAPGLENRGLPAAGRFDGAREDAFVAGGGEIAAGWSNGLAGAGIRIARVQESLGRTAADRASMDAGVLFKAGEDERTCIALAVKGISLNDGLPAAADAVPQAAELALGRQFLEDGNLFASLNAVSSADRAWSLSAGTALKIRLAETWSAIVRAGFTHADNGAGNEQGMAAGAGVVFKDIVFSYTYNALVTGGLSHVAGISYRFARKTDIAVKRLAVKEPVPVVYRGGAPHDDRDIGRIMKNANRELLTEIDQARDVLILSGKATPDDLRKLDGSRDIVINMIMDGKYDDALMLGKYLYQGYIYLHDEIKARELLKETEARLKKTDDEQSYRIEFYKQGLQEYVNRDMDAAIASMNKYIAAGGQFYKEKARQILAAAYLKSGMESYNAGALVAAAAFWRNGIRNDPVNAELSRCMKEYIEPKCNEYFNAGMAAYAQGDMGRAESMWKACLEMSPEDERAVKALQRLR